MTYPRTPEEKARQLGERLACEAFNACGSLDARKCQEMGDALGEAIAELVVSTVWQNARDRWAGYQPPRLPEQDLLDRAIARLRAPLEIPTDLDTFAGVTAKPSGTAWAPLVSEEDAVRIGKEVHEDYLAAKAEAERIGKELDEISRRKARGLP